MNQNIKVKIKGKYIFRDSSGNITRVVDNLITDWGFKRFNGAVDHYVYQFWWNMKYLFIGEQTATELPADFELYSYHIPNNYNTEGTHLSPPRPFTTTPTFFIKHASKDPLVPGAPVPWHSGAYNPGDWDPADFAAGGVFEWPPKMNWEGGGYNNVISQQFSRKPDLVGVTYHSDPLTGDIIVRFANTWDLKFNAAITVGELGVGPTPLNGGDNGIVEAGGVQAWSQGSVSSAYDGSSPTIDPSTRLGHTNSANFSLFSRATMNPQAYFNPGDETTITYLCDVVLCKEMDLSYDMPFTLAPGSVPTDAFPPNATGMRQVPFFKLPGTARNNHYGSRFVCRNLPPIRSSWDDQVGVATPLLDNRHITEKTLWVLDTFKYTLQPYPTLVGTLTADHQEYTVAGFGQKAIANPIDTEPNKRPGTTPENPKTYIHRYHVASKTHAPVTGSGFAGSENIYITTLNFFLPSNHWIVGGTGGGEEMNSFTLWRPINNNHHVKLHSREQTGFHTFLSALYSPSPDKFIKLTYQITWTR